MATQTNTTRRALVSSLAALPVAAAAPAVAGEHPDAELLRLGEALRQAVARVEAFPSKQAWDAYGDAQAGSIEAIRSRGESLDDNEEELMAAVAPYQGAVDRDEELRRAADRIQDAIHKIAPRTVDGLKVHAEAMAWAFHDAWDKPLDHLDWHKHCARRLVEAARAMPSASA
jgi:hypothetical protein